MKKWLISTFLSLFFLTNPLAAKKNLGIYLAGEAAEGLFLYSWLVPAGLGINDGNAFLGTMLITPMMWTGLSYLNSASSPEITGGMLLSSLYGGIIGAAHGLFIGDDNIRPGLALTMSVLENFGNFHLFEALDLNAASAERWENFAGLGIFHVSLFDNLRGNLTPLYGIVSMLEAYGSIPVFMRDKHATWGDAFFESVSSHTMLGSVWLISIGIDESALDNHDAYRVISGLASTTAGYGLGYYLSRKYDLSTGGAIFTLFVPTLLDMMVTGSGILLSSSNNMQPWYIIGGVLLPVGVYGSYFLFAEKEKPDNPDDTGWLKFYVNPTVATMALLKNRKGFRFNSVPVVGLNLSF